MLGNDASVLPDYDAVGVSMDFDRPSDGTGRDRVFVVVEAHEAGLRYRGRYRMESVEPAGIGNEFWPFGFEHFPNRLFGQFRMPVRLGVGDAFASSHAFSSTGVLNRSRGVKKRSRTSPTWFSTWPFSQPEAGVQATGSTR